MPITKNDGVVDQPYISYLKLNGTQGAQLTPGDLEKLGTDYSYTLAMWIRPFGSNFYQNNQNLFKLENDLICKFSNGQLTCGGSQLQNQISIDATAIPEGKWSHLVFAGQKGRKSYLQITNNAGQTLANATSDYIPFKQFLWNWKACVGDCGQGMGFEGGVRELILMGIYTDEKTSSTMKNYQQGWNYNSLIYQRFNEDRFLKDEVWSTRGNFFGGQLYELVGRDLLPQDVCPVIRGKKSFYYFGSKYQSTIKKITYDGVKRDEGYINPSQSSYEYTMSMMIMPTHHWCHVPNPYAADLRCNLWNLENVMMLYKTGPDKGRFFFMAQKFYHETKSNEFEIPTNQWIRIDIQLSRWGGYEIRTYDALGRQRYFEKVKRDMNFQKPTGKMQLFNQFRGYAKYFILFDQVVSLPVNIPTGRTKNPNCLTFYKFDEGTKYNTNVLVEDICKSFAGGYDMHWSNGQRPPIYDLPFYERLPSSKATEGTPDHNPQTFDGITCDDQSTVLQSLSTQSFIEADISKELYVNQNTTSMTIEFWIKLAEDAWKNTSLINKTIVSVQGLGGNSTEINKNREVLAITTNSNGTFQCESLIKYNQRLNQQNDSFDIVDGGFITYPDLKQDNEDEFKWFHITCTFESQNKISGFLSNDKFTKEYVQDNKDYVTLLPVGKYRIRIGKSYSGAPGLMGMQIKDFKLWSESRSRALIQKYKFRQVDPTEQVHKSLEVYLRLVENNFQFINLVHLSDFTVEKNVVATGFKYVFGNTQDELNQKTIFHLICPVHTYYSNKQCYDHPMKKLWIAIIPKVNQTSNELEWHFTPDYSPFVDQSLIKDLKLSWKTDHPIINTQINETQRDLVLPQRILKEESSYLIQVEMRNNKHALQEKIDLNFVPMSCNYFVIQGTDAFSSIVEFDQNTGESDVQIILQLTNNENMKDPLKVQTIRRLEETTTENSTPDSSPNTDQIESTKETELASQSVNTDTEQTGTQTSNEEQTDPSSSNQTKEQDVPGAPKKDSSLKVVSDPQPVKQVAAASVESSSNSNPTTKSEPLQAPFVSSCPKGRFYNKFQGMNATFLVPGSSTTITQSPKLKYNISPDQSQIVVTIPADEQQNLPMYEDVQLAFDVFWTNSEFSYLINKTSNQFQNVIQTFKFAPKNQRIINKLNVTNYGPLIQGETTYFDMSDSYVSGAKFEDSKKRIKSEWICDEPYTEHCTFYNGEQYLYIEDDLFISSKLTAPKSINFINQLSWVNYSNKTIKSNKTVSIVFTNLTEPALQIQLPEKIIATANENQVINLKIDNYKTEKLDEFNFKWTITPEIQNGEESFNQRQYIIPQGGLKVDTEYTVTVEMIHKEISRINNTQSVQFKTKLPPYNGTIKIEPEQGFLGENFTASISGWKTDNKLGWDEQIQWRMWTTKTLQGKIKDQLIFKEWANASQQVEFTASSVNPYLFEIRDSSQEIAHETFYPKFLAPVVKPQQLLQILQSPVEQKSLKYAYMNQIIDDNGQGDNRVDDNKKDDILKSNNFMVDFLQNDINNNNQTDEKQKTQQATKSTAYLANIVGKQDSVIDNQIAQKSLRILTQLQEDEDIMESMSQDRVFLENYSNSVGGLINYNSQSAESIRANDTKRKLMSIQDLQDSNNQLISLNEKILDMMCKSLKLLNQQDTIKTTSYDIIIEKFSVEANTSPKVFVSKNKYGSDSSLEIDTEKIIENHLEGKISANEQPLCLQIVTFKSSPDLSLMPDDQQILHQDTGQTFILKLKNNQGKDIHLDEYDPLSNIKFQIAPDYINFDKNQTKCMSFQESSKTWSNKLCKTEISIETSKVICKCSMIGSSMFSLLSDITVEEGETINWNINLNQFLNIGSSKSFAYVLLAFSVFVCGIAGQLLALVLDRRDKSNKSDNKDHMLISDETMQIMEKFRNLRGLTEDNAYEQLMIAESMCNCERPPWTLVISRVHFGLSQFFYRNKLESRFLSFSKYMTAVSIYLIFLCFFYSNDTMSHIQIDQEGSLNLEDFKVIVQNVLVGMVIIQPWQNLIFVPSKQICQTQGARYVQVFLCYALFLLATALTIIKGKEISTSNMYSFIICLNVSIFLNCFISESIRALFVQIIAEKAYQKRYGLLKFIANFEVVRLFQNLVSYKEAKQQILESQLQKKQLQDPVESDHGESQKQMMTINDENLVPGKTQMDEPSSNQSSPIGKMKEDNSGWNTCVPFNIVENIGQNNVQSSRPSLEVRENTLIERSAKKSVASPNRKSQIDSIKRKVKICATQITEQNETVGSQRNLNVQSETIN